MFKIFVFFIISFSLHAQTIPREEFERRLGNVIPLVPIAEHIGDVVADPYAYKMTILQSRDEAKLGQLERGKTSYLAKMRTRETLKEAARRRVEGIDPDAILDPVLKDLVILLQR